MPDRVSLPFVPPRRFDASRHEVTLAELARQSGDIQAQHHLRRGEIAGARADAITRIGRRVIEGMSQHVQEGPQREIAALEQQQRAGKLRRDAATQEAIQAGGGDWQQTGELLRNIDPFLAQQAFQHASAEEKAAALKTREQLGVLAREVGQFDRRNRQSDPRIRDTDWKALRTSLIAEGIGTEDMPETYNPAYLSKLMAKVPETLDFLNKVLPPPDPMEVSPSNTVIDKNNPAAGPLYTAPAAPVKPAAPPSVGSFEDFVIQQYGERPTAAQITAARKEYNQADDRPQVSINMRRPITETAESALINRYATEWQKHAAPVTSLKRQITIMNEGLKAADRGDMGPASEAVMTTFLKILDPDSVVRESEFWRLQQGQSLISRVQAAVQRSHQGGWATKEELNKYAQLAREITQALDTSLDPQRKRLERNMDRYNIPHDLVFDAPTAPPPPPGGGDTGASRPAGAPQMGDLRTIRGQQMRITRVYPDGTFDAEPVRRP